MEQVERKKTIPQIKKSLDEFSSKLHIAEEWTNKCEDIAMKNFQTEAQRAKRQKGKKAKRGGGGGPTHKKIKTEEKNIKK